MEGEDNNLITPTGDFISFDDTEGFDMTVFSVPESSEDQPGEDSLEGTVENIETEKISDPVKEQEESVANEDKTDVDEGEESSSPNMYSSLANVLKEQSIFSSLESTEEIKDAESLLEAFDKEIKNREYFDLSPEQKTYLQALRNGVPEERVKEHLNLQTELGSITEEMLQVEDNVELRKALITENFKRKGFDLEKAELFAQRSIDIGADVEDSKEALNDIKTDDYNKIQADIKATEEAKKKQEQEFKKSLETLQKRIRDSKEIIPDSGLTLTDVAKDKLYKQMTKPVEFIDGKPVSAIQKKRMENPMEFELRLNYLFQLTNGFEDFSKLEKKVKSKAVNQLDKVLQGSQFASPGNSGNVQNNLMGSGNDFENLGEIL